MLDREAVDALARDADVLVHLAFIILGGRDETRDGQPDRLAQRLPPPRGRRGGSCTPRASPPTASTGTTRAARPRTCCTVGRARPARRAPDARRARGWPLTADWRSARCDRRRRRLGFLLGVPIFYGPSRSVQMSWQAALCATLLGAGFAAAHGPHARRCRPRARRALRAPRPARRASRSRSSAARSCMAAARAGWFGLELAAWLMTLSAVAGWR